MRTGKRNSESCDLLFKFRNMIFYYISYSLSLASLCLSFPSTPLLSRELPIYSPTSEWFPNSSIPTNCNSPAPSNAFSVTHMMGMCYF